jgi:hypothetical protein
MEENERLKIYKILFLILTYKEFGKYNKKILIKLKIYDFSWIHLWNEVSV